MKSQYQYTQNFEKFVIFIGFLHIFETLKGAKWKKLRLKYR